MSGLSPEDFLRSVLGATVVEEDAPPAEPYCGWPGCNDDPAVSADGGDHWSCWRHVTDDFLPPLTPGAMGACVHCRATTTRWWVRWPERPDVALHDHCLRPWARQLAEAAASGPPPVLPLDAEGSTQRAGAYARRRAGGR